MELDDLKDELATVLKERNDLAIRCEALTKKVNTLSAWYDKMFGTPCEEIRHQQQIEKLEKERDELKAIVYKAKFLAQEVHGWGMQTETHELDLTTAEFGETWKLAEKIRLAIEKKDIKPCAASS